MEIRYTFIFYFVRFDEKKYQNSYNFLHRQCLKNRQFFFLISWNNVERSTFQGNFKDPLRNFWSKNCKTWFVNVCKVFTKKSKWKLEEKSEKLFGFWRKTLKLFRRICEKQYEKFGKELLLFEDSKLRLYLNRGQ